MSNFSRLLGIVPKFSSTLSSMMSLNTSKSAPWYLLFIHLNRPYSPSKYSAFRLKHQAAEHSLKDLAKASEVQHNSTASAANASEDNTQLDYEEIISQNLAYIYYLKKLQNLDFYTKKR